MQAALVGIPSCSPRSKRIGRRTWSSSRARSAARSRTRKRRGGNVSRRIQRRRVSTSPLARSFASPSTATIRRPCFTLDDSEDLYHLDEHTKIRGLFAAVERVYLAAGHPVPRAMALVDRPEPIEPVVFLRGDPERRGERVARRYLSLLSADDAPFRDGSGRLELARAVVDPRGPLAARVIVNRVWAWHFGRGLVATPSDFGVRSAPPTHPELLDWLAATLIEEGWSLKKLHRRIVLSATWQQANARRDEPMVVDPDGALLWRRERRRLEFEALRDGMLAVAGRLDRTMGGEPVATAPDDSGHTRRTVYGIVDRELLPGVLRVFDFPSPGYFLSGSRPHDGAATGALSAQQSVRPCDGGCRRGGRARGSRAPSPRTACDGCFVACFSAIRRAEDEALAVEYVTERLERESRGDRELRAWSELAQVLLQSNEFQFVD